MTDRTNPLPADAVLDFDRLPQLIGDAMLASDPDDDLRRDLVLDTFSWMVGGFDDAGYTNVQVINKRDGRLLGTVRVPRSALVV